MSRVSKLLSFAVLIASLTILPRAIASSSRDGGNVAQAEQEPAGSPHASDGTWALLLMGLFAVWAIATYSRWDGNAESSGAKEYDTYLEPSALAVNEWTAAEQKLARMPPASETLTGQGGKSRVA